MNENYFMGLDGFVWFTGVVENRDDPAKLGRVQVRCLGFHTENLIDIPSADLPWAHVMHPVTDPAMQGLGNSPSFLTEGSWVMGFFRDANEKQQPIIMGSLPGVPQTTAKENISTDNRGPVDLGFTSVPSKGFNDPNGKYPGTIEHSYHTTGESDVSRLARGENAESHKQLIERRKNRIGIDVAKGIVISKKPSIPSVSTNTTKLPVKNKNYSEPHPRGVETTGTDTGQYPFNHVHESESGHISEIDDTPKGERLLTQHKSGTYEEIVADGTKTVKVVGDNYEMVIGGTNIFIQGDVNMTTSGNLNQFVKKDYVLEVEGDYTRLVHGNEQVKIGENLEEVVLGNHSYNIGGTLKGSIGTDTKAQSRDYDLNVGGSFGTTVGGDHFITSMGSMILTTAESLGIISLKTTSITAASSTEGNVAIVAGTSLDMKSVTKMSIASETTIDMDATTEVDIDSALINLN